MRRNRYISIPKVNKANSKVNRANAQSRPAGFYLHLQMASCVLRCSLRFAQHKTTCPTALRQGEGRAPKSCVRWKNIRFITGSLHRITTKIQII